MRSPFAAAFTPLDDSVIRKGESLGDAFARRLGIPLANRPDVDPHDVPHPVNRAARRADRRKETR